MTRLQQIETDLSHATFFFIAITGGLDYTTISIELIEMTDVLARHGCRTPTLTS
jgi:hypothetical protein